MVDRNFLIKSQWKAEKSMRIFLIIFRKPYKLSIYKAWEYSKRYIVYWFSKPSLDAAKTEGPSRPVSIELTLQSYYI